MRPLPLLAFLLLCSCAKFDAARIMVSPEGVVATIAAPPTGDAFTVCFADRALATCSPSEAAIYVYRAEASARWWEGRNTFVVQVFGGDVRKMTMGRIRVGNKEIVVRYDACRSRAAWADNDRIC